MVRVHMWRRPATPAPRQRPAPPPHTAPGPAGAAPAARDQGSARNVQEVLAELDALVGLREVKALVREMRALLEVQQRRQREGLATEPLVWHMIFKGNPGTGKTTVARILGRLFKEMGVLPKGHLVEVERADLVGEYIGHTAQKTREQVRRAMGGILFIDEAYSLARGGNRDFGKEAIDVLVKAMEDARESLVLILAGYHREMDAFLEANPGLRSRFPIHISFPDYSVGELLMIADLMLRRRQYVLSPGAREELRAILEGATREHCYSGNARLVRNILERAIRRQALRLTTRGGFTRHDLMVIMKEDIVAGV